MTPIKRISIIGAGNVATSLSKAIVNKGFTLLEVFSQKKENIALLRKHLPKNCLPKMTTDIKQLDQTADCYIVCVKDDALATVLEALPLKNKLVVHTSGSIGMDVFNGFARYGVFYPLQTFSKENPISLKEVPICIEANQPETEKLLMELGHHLSEKVVQLNSQQRETLHLAAVFACNFSNYLYSVAEEITTAQHIDFSLLHPLILETAKKIQLQPPKAAQTGPAKRHDKKTINKQLQLLKNSPHAEVYQLLTQLIEQQG